MKRIILLIISIFMLFNTAFAAEMMHTAITDENGIVEIEVPVGKYEIVASKNGYVVFTTTTEVKPITEVHELDITLQPKRSNGGGGYYGGGVTITPPTESDEFTWQDYVNKFPRLNLIDEDATLPTTRAEIATLFSEMFNVEYSQDKINFPDVAPDLWYSNAVANATRKALMFGDAEGTFRPNDIISRSEIAAVIVRTMGFDEKSDLVFSDITTDHWAFNYILQIVKSEIMIGDEEGTFRPDDGITREEIIIVINRLLKI